MQKLIALLLLFTPAGLKVQTQGSPYVSDKATTAFVRVLSLLCNAWGLLSLVHLLGLPGVLLYAIAAIATLKFTNII